MSANSGMKNIAGDLCEKVRVAALALEKIPESVAAVRPAPGKWSPKEILGHLIDSAANNHNRFVRAQLKEDLVFEGYAQDDWVSLQDYQSAKWIDLVAFWKVYNVHLAHVIERIPEEAAFREIYEHNMRVIVGKTFPENAPATLAYLISDYVNHMEHHLRQILN